MSIFAMARGKRSCLAAAAAAAMGLAAITGSAPAEAAVTYSFTQTGADFGDSTFTLVLSDYITADGSIAPTSCSVTNSPFSNIVCEAMRFDVSPYESSGADSDYIGFSYSHDPFPDPNDPNAFGIGGEAFYFFMGGALGANGTYFTAPEFNPPGAGSASQASLTVSGAPDVSAVPEPASWAMMIGGVAMVGGALRRRQRFALRLA